MNKSEPFPTRRDMTLHDRDVGRRVPAARLAADLETAREFQRSEFASIRTKGYVIAGQIRAELLRRQKE